jgi:thioredoxin-like negative regulator of GroEL
MKFYKFYADWCGPCKVLTTNLRRAGVTDYEPIDVDKEENEYLVVAYNIRNIPVFVAVKEENGVENEVDRFVGIKSPDAIKQWIEALND